MSRAIILTVLLAGLILVGTSTTVWAAQLDAKINPNAESFPFKMSYLKTVFIEYPNGGNLFEALHGNAWTVSGTADSSDPAVQELIGKLNQGIVDDGSQARISDLNVSYDFHLKARNTNTSIDYKVILEGTLTNHIITQDSQRTLVDMGWRGITAEGSVVINDVDINIPINLIADKEPEVYTFLAGTKAEEILSKNLINADFILEQPLTNWHFLFDPTGINADAKNFGLDKKIAGFVISTWTMGESSFREGIQTERVFKAEITSDENYVVRSVRSADIANLSTIGFGVEDVIDGVEIVGITPTSPIGYGDTSAGDFPIMIIYGMAGLAAVAGIGFFIFSNRSLKNEAQGQQGIDPSRLEGYDTSDSSGGYKTNRGEAQLKDDTDYQQTRSVYEESSQQSPPLQATPATMEDQACGCEADSGDPDYACDCAMQGACICSADCKCNTDVCKEAVRQLS